MQEYGVGIFEVTETKSALKKILKKEHITVDGKIATSATLLKGGEKICLVAVEKEPLNKILDLKLKILFEDDYLAIVHKPAGIVVSGNTFKTIANALPQNLKTSNLSDATTPQPIHRLDFGTTGLLLVGKMNRSIRALNKLFEKQEIQKTYYAVTIGEMRYFGRITSPIEDKEAQSNYTLDDSVSSERFGKLNLVQLEPKTGRKHQLRKHLSSIGNPILGDTDYGIENLILKGKGLYLHAYSLKFMHPFTNELVHVKDELPEKFKKIFTQQE